jgi:hypothetical protein
LLIDIPSDVGLLGGVLVSQWVDFGRRIASSNALVTSFSNVPPTLGISMVIAHGVAPSGIVKVTRAPVVRFDLQ